VERLDEVRAILAEADMVDAHCDMEVPARLVGYDPRKHHGNQLFPRPFWGHADYPRLRQGGFKAVVHDVPTNIFKGPKARLVATYRNVGVIAERVASRPGHLASVANLHAFRQAREQGKLAVFTALQGGNAVEADLSVLQSTLGQRLHRITVVHLSSSCMGGSSSPSQPDEGITPMGIELVERCNAARVLVDLSHAGPRTFQGILDAHDPTLPPIVSHTGVSALRPHWRNLSDDQIRAVASRGGVVGILFHGNFLAKVPPGLPCRRARILDHLEHVIAVGGEGAACLGSDFDGMITPPSDMPDASAVPALVYDMLERGWPVDRIHRVLGGNYFRVVGEVREGPNLDDTLSHPEGVPRSD